MKKILIVINEHSGAKDLGPFLKGLRRSLYKWNLEFYMCRSIKDTIRFRSEIDESQYRCAFVVGGDGTVNSFLLVDRKSSMPIFAIPTGTANDLSNTLRLNLNLDRVVKLVENIEENTTYMDVISVNGRPFITTGGLGIPSKVLENYERSRRNKKSFQQMHSFLGRDIYKLLTIKHSFVSFINARKYRLKWDDNIEVIDSSCIMVTNQAKMGGNILVHPAAKINDGKFNVFVSKETKAIPLIKSLSDMSRGVVPRNSLLIETENLIIESVDGSKVSYFGDGEVFGNANRMNFSIQKQAQPFVADMEREYA